MIDIDISAALTHPGKTFPFSYEGEPKLSDFQWKTPLKIDAGFGLFDECVRVEGTVDTSLTAQCSRCLTDVTIPVHTDFSEIFMSDPGDEDVYAFNGETKSISLDQMILDMLSTDLPMQILCSETCKGLCPECGQNLNEGSCDCNVEDKVSPDNPFAKLKDLF